MKRYVAEFIGTFVLAMAVTLSLGSDFPVMTPIIAALAAGYGVYAVGQRSGGHFNPAITLGVLTAQEISIKDALIYLAAQLTGAAAAMLLAMHCLKIKLPSPEILDNLQLGGAEGFGMFVFAFGFAAVVHEKVTETASGLAVGVSFLLGILVAVGAGSAGILNPAIALAIGSASVVYLVAPILAAIAAMLIYKYLID